MIFEELKIVSFQLIVRCSSRSAPCCYYDVFALYGLIIVKSEDLPDLPAKCVPYDTVSYLFTYTDTQSVMISTVIFYIHNKNTVGFALNGVVNTAVFTVFLNRRKSLHKTLKGPRRIAARIRISIRL